MHFLFRAGLPWLDFVNTRPMMEGGRVDLLDGGPAVEAWLAEAGKRYGPTVSDASISGRSLHREAIELREVLDGLAVAAASGKAVPKAVLAELDARLGATPGSLRLTARTGAPPEVHFRPDPKGAALFPVVRSAAEWIAAGGKPAVRACGNPDCVLYVADTTKSGTRRWCDTASCGNRERVKRFRRKEGR